MPRAERLEDPLAVVHRDGGVLVPVDDKDGNQEVGYGLEARIRYREPRQSEGA
jgi:hypothetical protein